MITITNQNKQFIVYSPLTTKSIEEFTKQETANDGERILLEGIASTSNKDLQGDIIAPEAIKSMAQQAPGLNIHGDHHYGLNDVIGAIQKSEVQEGNLHIQFLVTKRHTPIIQDMLDTGVNLGLSIGGFVEDYDYTHNEQIKNIKLAEISLTPMPANWDTYGTVQSKGLTKSNCITGACYEIMKRLEVKNMAEEKSNEQQQNNNEEQEKSEFLTRENVTDLVNELFASKEQDIIDTVISNTETKVKSIVQQVVKEELGRQQEEENTGSDSEVEEPASTKNIISSEDINTVIKEEFDSLRKDIFKNISKTERKESHIKKALDESEKEEDEKHTAGYSLKSISERLASNDSKTALIKQIQQQ